MGGLANCDDGVALLVEWLKTQGHLPQSIDKMLLQRFLRATQGDVEAAKKLIDLNYTMRTNYSHIFLKRDPCDEATQRVLDTTDMIILPNLTPEGNKVLYYRLIDFDPDKYHFNDVIRVFFMFADVRFNTPDPAGMSEGEIPIFDMKGFTLKHLTKVVLSTLRIYMKFTQEAHPIRLKAIHVVNCPSYLDKVITVIKPFLRSEVFKMINFHLSGAETLYKYVPKEMLPNDLGGQCGQIADIKSEWVKVLKEKRDYLTNEKYWKVDEKKRTKSKGHKVPNESFQSLSID